MVNFLVGYHTIVFDGSDVVCPSLYVWYGVVWYAVHQQALIDWVTDEKNRRFSIQQEEKDSIIEAIQNTDLTEDKLQYQKDFVEWVEGQIVKGTGTETEQELAGKAVKKDRFTPNEAQEIIVIILEKGYYPGDAYLKSEQNVSDFFLGRLHDEESAPNKAARRANALTGDLLKRFSLTQPTSGQGMCGVMIN